MRYEIEAFEILNVFYYCMTQHFLFNLSSKARGSSFMLNRCKIWYSETDILDFKHEGGHSEILYYVPTDGDLMNFKKIYFLNFKK